MSEGYVGQIFNSIQGEGLYFGRRQVFLRFAGCSLNCKYCDTENFRSFHPSVCEIETKLGSMKFKRVMNPMTLAQVLQQVKRLSTPDIHSLSLTGGEPLQAGDFLVDVTRVCRQEGFKIYLETNGASSEAMKKMARHTDIAAIDIKLLEHSAVSVGKWPSLLKEELSYVELSLKSGVETFVKIVVLSSTNERTISRVCGELAKVGDVPLVLQPVTPCRLVSIAPSMTHVYHLSRVAARAGIKKIAIIPQVHKLMGGF